MSSHHTHEKGSAHVIIISILVAALLGALGFIFWQNFIKKADVSSNASSNQTTAPTASTTTVSSTKYLVVTEWGAKFPYVTSVDINNDELGYSINGNYVSVFPSEAKFKPGGACDGAVVASIQKGSADQQVSGVGPDLPTFATAYGKGSAGRVGDAYFVQGSIGPGGCDNSESSASLTAKINALSAVISKAIPQVQSAN